MTPRQRSLADRLSPDTRARLAAMPDAELFWYAEVLARLSVPWHRIRLDLYEALAGLVIPLIQDPDALAPIEADGDALEARYRDAVARAWAAAAEQLRRIDPAQDPLATTRPRP